MDIQAYFNRIGYTGSRIPNLQHLQDLQLAHLLHVPFENLDIHHGTPIYLDIDRIYQKVIQHNRGGFCYELNGLFYELLTHMGYQTKRISACVFDEKKRHYGPEFDHLAIIVHLDGQDYLVDVGCGDFILQPLLFQVDLLQQDPSGIFRIVQHDDVYFRVEKKLDKLWDPEYIFTTKARNYQDYAGMCHYQQTDPNSYFLPKRLCTLAKTYGRATIKGDVLKITRDGEKTEIQIKDEAHYHQILADYFSIQLST